MRRCLPRLGALAALLLGASGCALAGQIAVAPHPADLGPPPADLGAVAVWVPVPDADALAAWWVATDEGAPGVVLVHGVRHNRLRLVGRARALAEAGFAVLMVDLPGHGESPGQHIGFGWTERHAVAASVAYLRQLRPGTRVGVLGISLGGAAAVFAGPDLGADALVLEMVYPSLEAAVRNRMGAFTGAFGPLTARALLSQVEPRLGIPLDSLRTVDAVARLNVPVFVIGGAADPFTPPDETLQLYDAVSGLKAIWLVEGGRHEDLFLIHPERYHRRVVDFFEATLGQDAPQRRSRAP